MIRRLPSSTTVTCKRCKTVHLNVPVEYDEDGPYAELDTEMCSEDGCMKELCPSCQQFVCDFCQLTFCTEHKVLDGGLEVCSECARQSVDEGAEELAEAREAEAVELAASRRIPSFDEVLAMAQEVVR